jgi:hypothetical protein
MHPNLTRDDVAEVVAAVDGALEGGAVTAPGRTQPG